MTWWLHFASEAGPLTAVTQDAGTAHTRCVLFLGS